jgi:hypothetical protein
MKRKRPKRQDVDLVHVCWGPTDQGVVSLRQGRWLYYVWGDHIGGHHSSIPTVGIEDADFRLIMEPLEDDPDCYEATWNDVPRLLNHRRFPLTKRIGGDIG